MGLFFNWKRSRTSENEAEQEIMHARQTYPFYIKAPMVIIGIYLFFYIMFLLQAILVPFAFAGLIAILLNPIYNRFQKWKINKIVAISLTILMAILVVALVLFFLSSQIVQFGDMIPQLKQKTLALVHEIQIWLSERFGISAQKQVNMLNEAMNGSKAYIGSTLNTVFGMLSFFVLIPLYIFLLLFYKPLILNFIYEVFDEDNQEQVADILQETKGAVQSYVVGLMIEMSIIAVLN